MCEVVEKYAEERAREAVKDTEKIVARNLFLKGADYDLVQQSVQNLSKKELDEIYKEAMQINC